MWWQWLHKGRHTSVADQEHDDWQKDASEIESRSCKGECVCGVLQCIRQMLWHWEKGWKSDSCLSLPALLFGVGTTKAELGVYVNVRAWESDTEERETPGGIACKRRGRQLPRASKLCEMWWTSAVSVSHACVCVCEWVSKSFLVTESAHRLYDPAQWAGLLHHHQPPIAHINTHTHTHTHVSLY